MHDGKKKHLLLIRLSAMGDVAMTAPVVAALRAANPDLKISVLTRPLFGAFFRIVKRADAFVPGLGGEDFDGVEIITPDFEGRHKGLVGIVRLWRDVTACGVTHMADLHNVLRTKILRRLARLSGVKVSVVDKGRTEKRLLTRKHQKEIKQLQPMWERYREALLKLGFDVPLPVAPTRSIYPVPEEIVNITGPKNGVWIGIAPFAKYQGKIYPREKTDELIGLLTARYERVFVFGGGQYEKQFAEAMEERHKGTVSVIGKIKMDGELDLISNIDVMVTMDSASMHMSSLLGVPVVSVWGATHPFAGFYGFGQNPDNAVQLDLLCRPCSVYGNKPCIFKDYRCLGRIPPKAICARVSKVLGQ